MIITRTLTEICNYLENNRKFKKVGLIPTMGSIHKGHLSLIQKSNNFECFTCATIFINPLQFNNENDYKNYPKNETKDIDILKNNKCDLLFIPAKSDIIPSNVKTEKQIEKYRNILCDNFRQNHFDGVTTIVNILLKLFKPEYVFFGEKDYQQLKIVEELIEFKKINTNLISCKSIRDINGMSLSSRYSLFDPHQLKKFKEVSIIINNTINNIKKNIQIEKEISNCRISLQKIGISKIDYIEVREENNLTLSDKLFKSRLFIGIYLDKVRIIDNFTLY